MRLLRGCYAVPMGLLGGCYAVAMKLQCGCYKVAMRFLCGCYEFAVQLQCTCYVLALRLLCLWDPPDLQKMGTVRTAACRIFLTMGKLGGKIMTNLRVITCIPESRFPRMRQFSKELIVVGLESIGIHRDSLGFFGIHLDPFGSIEIHWDSLDSTVIHWDLLGSIGINLNPL